MDKLDKHLIDNYRKYNGSELTQAEAEKYAAVILTVGNPRRASEVEEIVRFQEYYKVELPIINKGI